MCKTHFALIIVCCFVSLTLNGLKVRNVRSPHLVCRAGFAVWNSVEYRINRQSVIGNYLTERFFYCIFYIRIILFIPLRAPLFKRVLLFKIRLAMCVIVTDICAVMTYVAVGVLLYVIHFVYHIRKCRDSLRLERLLVVICLHLSRDNCAYVIVTAHCFNLFRFGSIQRNFHIENFVFYRVVGMRHRFFSAAEKKHGNIRHCNHQNKQNKHQISVFAHHFNLPRTNLQ